MPVRAGRSGLGIHLRSAPSVLSSCAWFGRARQRGHRRVYRELTMLGIKVAASTVWRSSSRKGRS